MVVALARGARRSGGRLPVAIATAKPGSRLVSDVIGESAWTALDDQSSEAVRARAIARLVVLDPAGAPATLVKLFEPREPVAIQARAVRALAECERADAAKILLPRLRAFEPPVKGAAIATLLTRAAWTKSLLEAIGKSDPASGLGPALIEPADRAPLLKHRNVEIGQLAQKLFGQAAPSARATVIADYMAAMRVKGDRDRGARVFERECKTCHKIGDAGFALGPDLTGSPSRIRPRSSRIFSIPTPACRPRMFSTLWSTRTGEVIPGSSHPRRRAASPSCAAREPGIPSCAGRSPSSRARDCP